jgi:hypothetical protein
MDRNDSLSAPKALFRSGLALADLAALPLLAFGFLVILGTALASLGIAAGGVNFVLGLRYLDFFPTFPPAARVLSGLSLLAFSALLVAAALPLWHFYRAIWKSFWSWHRSAWQGAFVKLSVVPGASGGEKGAHRYRPLITLCGSIFLGLLALSVTLMLVLARGPFWHAWHWFS